MRNLDTWRKREIEKGRDREKEKEDVREWGHTGKERKYGEKESLEEEAEKRVEVETREREG